MNGSLALFLFILLRLDVLYINENPINCPTTDNVISNVVLLKVEHPYTGKKIATVCLNGQAWFAHGRKGPKKIRKIVEKTLGRFLNNNLELKKLNEFSVLIISETRKKAKLE